MTLFPRHYETIRAQVLDEFAGLMLPAHALDEGCEVRHFGEWVRFDGLAGDAMLFSTETPGFSYVPNVGETFAWRSAT